jgi:hypothetical protein
MKNDWEKIIASKEAYRRKLAALSFGEKLTLLDRMRERHLFFRNANVIDPKRTGKD